MAGRNKRVAHRATIGIHVTIGIAFCFFVLALTPAVAHADETAVFSGASPAPSSTALGVPAELSVIVSDASEPTAVSLLLNGVARSAYLTNGPTSGLPGYYELVWDPDEGEFYNHWVPLDPNLKKAVCPQNRYFYDYYFDDDHYYFNALVEGLNTIDVTVTSAEGISSHSWSFYYDPPPVISAVTPADGAKLSITTPTISATVTDDDAYFESVMTVDGAVVPTTYDASTKTFSYTPLLPFDVPSSHVASLQIRDAEERTVSRTWSFTVVPITVTFSDQVPAPGAIVTSPLSRISLTADSEVAALQTQNSQIYLDGVALTTTKGYPGHWVVDEWGDERWVIDDPTVLYMSATAPPLTDGAHAIDVRVRDANGTDFFTDWEFTVAIPPTASAITPSVPLTGTQPYISAIVTDNSPGPLNARIALDGQPVDSVFNPATGLVSYTPDTPLAEGPHTAVFEMTDAAGNTSTVTREFTVSTSVFIEPSPADGETRVEWPWIQASWDPYRAPVQIRAMSDVGFDRASPRLWYDGIGRGSINVSGPAANTDLFLSRLLSIDDTKDGPHALRWQITDLAGKTYTEDIAFTVAVPPSLTAPIPASGVPVVNNSRPQIGLRIGDNSPGPFRVLLSVDGTVVSNDVHPHAGISGKEWFLDFRWTPTSDFATGSSHVAEATVTDAAGNTSTLRWEFQIAPPMYVDDCLSCHTDYLTAHPVDNCAACHGTEVTGPLHWSDYAGPAPTPAGSCGAGDWACHDDDETHWWARDGLLHSFSGSTMRREFGRSALGCTDCHSEQWPTVPRHTDATLDPVHDSFLADECTKCHDSSLVEEHAKYPSDSQVKYQCATCHQSTNPRVVRAIEERRTGCSSCHPSLHLKTWSYPDYYAWDTRANPLLMEIGDNPYLPGVHGNYTANTAKCGVCHSVHRAKGDGVKLLNTAVATCIGCHQAGGSTVTNVVVSWEAGGPHGAGDPASCLSSSCHLANPHGVGGSQYTIVAAKLLNPAVDTALAAAVSNEASSGISITNLNAEVLPADGGWDESTRSAVRTGYTCNQAGCHVQTMLAVLEPGWSEERFTASDGGTSVYKTGHLSVGTPDGQASFAPVTSCVSCHDQTDSATAGVWYSTVSGYTFPHSQTPAGTSNTGTDRAWLWMTIAGDAGGTDSDFMRSELDKAKDGACLKCHRNVDGSAGIGITR